MMNIRLCKMTKALCRRFFSEFENDPDVFLDTDRFSTYIYSPERADAHWKKQKDMNRMHLAIMLNIEPIGEIILKDIDRTQKTCTLSIHMRNDSVKNKGYGSKAEILALEYAFHDLDMETVFADAVRRNTRSQHVLKKVGFIETNTDESFYYYRCDKRHWKAPDL